MRWPAILLVCLVTQLGTHHLIAQANANRSRADTLALTPTAVPLGRQLIKAGVGLPLYRLSSVSPVFVTLALDLTLEQKVTNHIALVGGIENHYLFSRSAQLYSLELPIGLRYYFSISKRMTQRAQLTPFFRHYITLQTYNVLFADLTYDLPHPFIERYSRGKELDHVTNGGKYQEGFNMLQSAYFSLGTQLKVSKRNYLDMNVIIPLPALLHKNEYTLATPAFITIKYGLYWQK